MMHLKTGDKAPRFSCKDQHGQVHTLNDYKGQRLVLYFYPRDNTPACINQACNIRDHFRELRAAGCVVLGISMDDERKHLKFAEKYELPFPLLADTKRKMIDAYGVWGEKKFMGKVYDGIHRTTFVINEKGKIERIITKPRTKAHAEEILTNF